MSSPLNVLMGLLLAGLISSGCRAGGADRSGAPSEDANTVAEAVSDSVEIAVRSLNESYVRAVAAKDTAAMLDLFANEALVLIHNAPPIEGRAALRQVYTGFFTAVPDASMTLTADTVVVAASGELAYEIARYTVEGTAPGGIAWQDRGRYLVTFHPERGRWRIVAIAGASELPPPGAAADTAQ